MSLIHRACVALLSTALAVTLLGPGAAPAQAADGQSKQAAQAAHWLKGQLRHGVLHNGQFDFDDYGLTADTAFALTTLGHHQDAVLDDRRHVQARELELLEHLGQVVGEGGGAVPEDCNAVR